jgi:tRNA (guanine-N7-)-methyltransferase
MREVLTYSRRGSRFTPSQQGSWDAHYEAWVIPDEADDEPGFSLPRWFGREAPVIVEIGSGIGEATAVLAAARPDVDILAFEVWRPGVAHTLGLLAESGAENVRLISVDAVWSLEHLFGPGEIHDLWTFFPDPWPKTRHHKRRLVTLATDWAEYAERMQLVLDAEPGLTGGQVERWAERPVTKFERKGVEVGRDITDLEYTRVG